MKHRSLENGSSAHFVVRGTAILVAVLIVGGPFLANADVFSFMSKALGSTSETSAANVVILQNTQKMPLLQAPTNANPIPQKGIQDVSMVDDGTALSNENDAINVRAVSAASTSAADDVYRPSSDHISLYTVHRGDTLQQIAQMFDVTPNTILWANDLKKSQAIVPNQVLVILPISGIRYTVKKGDTLKSVAKAFKGDVDDIARYNGLDDTTLAVGDEIIIPNGESSIQESKPTPGKKGAFIAAIGGSIVDPGGYFSRPISGGVRTQGIHGHNGVDLASSYGTPILAAASGTIVISRSGGWNGGYGSYVVIQHANGMQTLYGHMSRVDVSVGEQVSKGQTIGGMGSTGQSTGVHLHFEVRGGKNPF